MNKKIILFILLALAAGTLAGYTGKVMSHNSADSEEKQTTSLLSTRPRFGDARPGSPAVSSRQTASSDTNESEMAKLDATLKQYVRMNTEELWNEFEELNKQTDKYFFTHNNSRELLLSYILNRLGQESPRQALAKINENKELKNYRYGIIDAWAKKNPEAALAYCQENLEGDKKDKQDNRMWKSLYISLLSAASPDKAIDYLLTLSPKECADNLYGPLSQITKKSPEKMTKIMEKLKSVKRQKWTDSYIASVWAKADWNAAEKWIQTLPEENRSETLGRAIASLPQDEALQKINTLDETDKINALTQLSQTLVWESPVKALDLIRNNLTEEQAVKVFEKGYYGLYLWDKEVISYLDKMPSGASKDSLLERAIQSQSPHDSTSKFFGLTMSDSLSLIDKMSSSQKKEQTIDRTLNQWVYTKPQDVKSWVEKSHLPEEKKKKFIQRCDKFIKSKEGNSNVKSGG